MSREEREIIEATAEAHRQADEEELARLQTLSPPQRWALIEKACELAAAINRSRTAAGLPPAEPAPWPESTWEFMRNHAEQYRE